MFSLYIPPNISNQIINIEFQKLMDEANVLKNCILGGDFNAVHLIWDNSGNCNSRSELIADILNLSQFFILNNG